MPPSEYKRLEELICEMDAKHERRHMEAMKELAQTKQTVHGVSLSLIGNEELGVDGIVKRVKTLETSDKSRKKREWVMLGAAGATGVGGGSLITWLLGLFK